MMDRIWEQLMKIAESSNGFIRTAQVEEAGLSRMHLGQYVNAGRLERIAKGLYVPTTAKPTNMRSFRRAVPRRCIPMARRFSSGGCQTGRRMFWISQYRKVRT